MRTVLATTFVHSAQLDADAGSEQLPDLLWRHVESFLRTHVAGWGGERQPEIDWREGGTSMTLRWTEWEAPDEPDIQLTECHLRYPHRGGAVDVEVCIATSDGRSHVSAVWRGGRGDQTTGAIRKLPSLVRALAAGDAVSPDVGLAYRPYRLEPKDVERFCRNVVQNSDRRTPVVLLAPDTRTERVAFDPDALAREVRGLAHVFVLADPAAAAAFRTAAGYRLPCYDGRVHLYWPAGYPEAKHRNWPHEYADAVLHRQVFQAALLASLWGYEPPGVIDDLRRRRRSVERREIEERLKQALGSETTTGKSRELLELFEGENQKLEADYRGAKVRIRGLESEVSRLQTELQVAIENLKAMGVVHGSREDTEALPSDPAAETRVWLSREAWITLERAAPSQRSEFEQELRKMNDKPELVEANSKTLSPRKSDCCIYPQGDKGIRIFFYEHPDGSVRVCELADHRDESYEALIDQRKVFRRHYAEGAFRPFVIDPEPSAVQMEGSLIYPESGGALDVSA